VRAGRHAVKHYHELVAVRAGPGCLVFQVIGAALAQRIDQLTLPGSAVIECELAVSS
jgi:hypothetical protein